MRVKLFTFRYSATLGGFDDSALQDYVKDKEVVAFREHYFTVNEVPHLVCVLTSQDAVVAPGATGAGPSSSAPRGRPDPALVLGDAERVLYNALRDWRTARARAEGVPPFLVFNNRQLVEIVRRRPDSANALGQVSGIGSGKLKRYGRDLLSLLGAEEPAGRLPPEDAP